MKKSKQPVKVPALLTDLLQARSPSGFEAEAQGVIDRALAGKVDAVEKDSLGNRLGRVDGRGGPRLMLAGHMDELGLIVKHIDKEGFLYFDTLGGHDPIMIPGRRVVVLSRHGPVLGVTGKRAVHLMTAEERKKVPELHEMWIDIGVASEKEARQRIAIGDPVVYDHAFSRIGDSPLIVGRAMDNKAGCYVVNETLLRLVKHRAKLAATVLAVSTSQEEIGTRGATTSAFAVDPDFAVAVDVGHATDHPDCDARKFGRFKIGGGPIISRGPNINPVVYQRLIALAEKEKIPHQIKSEPRPTGTDARAIQMARSGIATGLIAVPLRYMHTPNEMISLEDLEACVRLLTAFALSLKKGDSGNF